MMISLRQLQFNSGYNLTDTSDYRCQVNLNLYDSPKCETLATQALAGRYLRIVLPQPDESIAPEGNIGDGVGEIGAVKVQLCEDDYPGWLAIEDLQHLELADKPYEAIAVSRSELEPKLSAVIDFTHAAMKVPNEYLWGGTVGPNYDCSGLMQAAFRAVGVWLPRDAYQQEAFTQEIPVEQLEPGDLVFFGTPEKATHVALCLGEGRYIHSSGKKGGRNGIGIDQLSDAGNEVSRNYYRQLRGAGRVMGSYLTEP